MRKFVVVAAVLGLFAIPALAQADRGEHPGAVRFCQAERARVGVAAFRDQYGTDAFTNCVARHTRVRSEHLRDARFDCGTERGLIGVTAFRAKYGSGTRHRHAFVSCVKVYRASERAAADAARKACTARAAQLGRTAFREQWGAGTNDRLAFARCVDGTERDDSPTAAS
jgi:hypothetical protein